MTDPLAYIEAAHKRAEQTAQAAGKDGTPVWSTGHHHAVRDENDDAVAYNEGRPTEAQAAHIARHDPQATLRRIAADRKILAEHAPGDNESGVYDSECRTCWGPDSVRGECVQAKPYPCTTVRLIAEGWGWTEETT